MVQTMTVSVIVATAKNNVIGHHGDIPWRGSLPADMKYFADTTTGQAVIMGRKTFESIPKKFRPLPNRLNIVVSRSTKLDGENVIIVPSLAAAIQLASQRSLDAFIAGGGSIYHEAMSGDYPIDRVLRTQIELDAVGDTFFPELGSDWQLVSQDCHDRDDKNKFDYCFQTYERVKTSRPKGASKEAR